MQEYASVNNLCDSDIFLLFVLYDNMTILLLTSSFYLLSSPVSLCTGLFRINCVLASMCKCSKIN